MSSGLGGLGTYWTPQLNALCDHFQVVTYDHRGTGKSHREIPRPHRVEDMANDLLLVVQSLGPSHIVGHAAGGIAGLCFAAQHGDLVRTLTLVNCWIKPDRHFARCFEIRKEIYELQGPLAYLKAQSLFLYPANWITKHLTSLDEQAEHHVSQFQSKENLYARIDALLQFDGTEHLDRITCPVLVLSSDDDMLVPSKCSRELAASIAYPTLVEMPWGGHAVNITSNDLFNSHLVSFLRSHQRSPAN